MSSSETVPPGVSRRDSRAAILPESIAAPMCSALLLRPWATIIRSCRRPLSRPRTDPGNSARKSLTTSCVASLPRTASRSLIELLGGGALNPDIAAQTGRGRNRLIAAGAPAGGRGRRVLRRPERLPLLGGRSRLRIEVPPPVRLVGVYLGKESQVPLDEHLEVLAAP